MHFGQKSPASQMRGPLRASLRQNCSMLKQ
jgi:hypothetical protein